MNTKSADLLHQHRVVNERSKDLRRTVSVSLLVFLISYSILFMGMIRHPGIFDEGIILTGAMRVAANQIPHRDFYVLYGPAQFYLLVIETLSASIRLHQSLRCHTDRSPNS